LVNRALPVAPKGIAATDHQAWLWLALFAYAMLVSTYFVVRSGGQLAEHDTSIQASAVESSIRAGSLTPSSGVLYPNGFVYAAISAAVISFAGMDVSALQQVVYPLTSALLVIPAWALYSEVAPRGRVAQSAGIAVAVLFTQPEFLFFVLRGSHERFLRFLILIALWLLVRSFRFGDRPALFVVHVLLFYLTVFTLIGTNTFFGVSFLVAVTSTLALAWAASKLPLDFGFAVGTLARRLAVITTAVAGIVFLVTFYLYMPASHGLGQMNVLARRTAQLVTTTDSGTSPYSQVVSAWISPHVYFVLASSDYVLMLASAAVWLWLGASWLIGRSRPAGSHEWLLWLLYTAFAIQGALAILVDRTGLLGANLQHRSFPSFAMLAAPVVAAAGVRLPLRLPLRRLFGGAALALFAVLALLKATNEPMLSNKWTFYNPVELLPLAWSDSHLRDSGVWVGLDERLRASYDTAAGLSPRNNWWDVGRPDFGVRLYVVTPLVTLQSARFRQPLPPIGHANRVYDDGHSQVYRARPMTAFQL
jgi:hypothetical protein